jgi:hypothetical protein
MDLDYFGDTITDWVDELDPYFSQMMKEEYNGASAAALILLPGRLPRWTDIGSSSETETLSLDVPLIRLVVGDDDDRVAELAVNVEHKLRFVLRTGLDSSEAVTRPDLVEPGDFAFAGAGHYRGYTGGVSGLKQESDWWVFCRLVDRLIGIRTRLARAAMGASKNRLEGWKFMDAGGTPPVIVA